MSEEQTSTVEREVSEGNNIDPAEVAYFVQAVVKQRDDKEIQRLVAEHINALVKKYKLDNYKIVLLFDENDAISSWHSNRIYSAATSEPQKDILLLIQSTGGSIEPAYLISKTCRRQAKGKFVAVIPRRAKSAATLIALGANEIHMGLMSELGPIDPQFGGLPALSMQNALTLLADLSCKYPGSSEMLGKFLAEKLDLRILGYFDRVNGSAVQYAERLLEGNEFATNQTPKTLADHFVNYYKDHGFVIDADEASKYLGSKVIHQDSQEYQFGNAVHESLDVLKFLLDVSSDRVFDYVGSIDAGLLIRKQKEKP